VSQHCWGEQVLQAIQEVVCPSPSVTIRLDPLTGSQLLLLHRVIDSLRTFFNQGGEGLSQQVLEKDLFVSTMELLGLAQDWATEDLVCARAWDARHCTFRTHVFFWGGGG
jgi:hypothetical protein